jgi:hypothetical protein
MWDGGEEWKNWKKVDFRIIHYIMKWLLIPIFVI